MLDLWFGLSLAASVANQSKLTVSSIAEKDVKPRPLLPTQLVAWAFHLAEAALQLPLGLAAATARALFSGSCSR